MVSVWMRERERRGVRVPATHREFLHVCPNAVLEHLYIYVCVCVCVCVCVMLSD